MRKRVAIMQFELSVARIDVSKPFRYKLISSSLGGEYNANRMHAQTLRSPSSVLANLGAGFARRSARTRCIYNNISIYIVWMNVRVYFHVVVLVRACYSSRAQDASPFARITRRGQLGLGEYSFHPGYIVRVMRISYPIINRIILG